MFLRMARKCTHKESQPANYSDLLNLETLLIQVTMTNSKSGAARAAKGMKLVSDEI